MTSEDGNGLTRVLTPAATAEMLQRILEAVEKDRRNRWMEITCAFVLSLATTASAWCAYQSTLWSGVQTFRLSAATKAGRDSVAQSLTALQTRAFEASMFISYIQAKHEGNDRQEKFLRDRFRPEMAKAVDAWLRTDPFNDPKAPSGPFKMAEYVQKELEEAKSHDERYDREYASAQRANRNADTYVLLTVLFATVLFFGGIAGTLDSRRLRVAILIVALILFAVTLAYLGTMPVCRE